MNKIALNDKSVLFRADQYQVCTDEINAIPLKFVQGHFMGEYYLSEFCTETKETLFLTDKEPLNHVNYIQINHSRKDKN